MHNFIEITNSSFCFYDAHCRTDGVWYGNFGMKYARMEWKTIFCTSILDSAHGIYRKIYTDSYD